MKSVNCILFSLVLTALPGYAQELPDTLLAYDNRIVPLPSVSLNFGIANLMSDVALQSEGPSPFIQFGYQLSVSQRVVRFLNVSLDLFTGAVYGEEQLDTTNLNFRTSLFSQHLNIEYNFYPLLKPDARGRQWFRPYLGLGVGLLSFRSKGDLRDAAGTVYRNWSDGTIRAETEGTADPSETVILIRDFEYETDLRDANLDGAGKYSQTVLTLPFNAGIRFQITENVGVNAAFTYAMNFSDMLDNVSEDGAGDRRGSPGNDNYFYGSVGLTVFLGRTMPSAKPQGLTNELAEVGEQASEGKTLTIPDEKADMPSVDAPNRLQQQGVKRDSVTAEIAAILKESANMLSSQQEDAVELRNRLNTSAELTKADRTELSAIIVKQGLVSEKLKDLELRFGEDIYGYDQERDRIMETNNSSAELLDYIAEANEQLSIGLKTFSKELNNAKDIEDAIAFLGRVIQQSDNRGTDLGSMGRLLLDGIGDEKHEVGNAKDEKRETGDSINEPGYLEKTSSETDLAPKARTGNEASIENIGNTSPKEAGSFHWADVNHNGWISPDEVLHFIDLLFEGGAERTVTDIQGLIDYYFDQE